MANARLNLPTKWLIAAAIVAGVIAGGAFGLYVMGDPSGNNAPQVAASGEDDKACAASQDRAKPRESALLIRHPFSSPERRKHHVREKGQQ